MILKGEYTQIALDIVAASQPTECIAVGDVITAHGNRGLLPSAHPLGHHALSYVRYTYPRPLTLESTDYVEVHDFVPHDHYAAIAAVHLVTIWRDPDGTVRLAPGGHGADSAEYVMEQYFADAGQLEEVCRAEKLSRRTFTPPPPHTRLKRRYPRCTQRR